MKWINEPIANTGYSEPLFALSKEDIKILKPVFEQSYKEYKKKLDKLEDIRQSGEATEKQLDKWTILQEKIATIEEFINIGW